MAMGWWRWRARWNPPMPSRWRGSMKGSRCARPGIQTPTVLLEGVFDAGSSRPRRRRVRTRRAHAGTNRPAAPRALGASFKVWLKLDSGMNRLGFKGAAFDARTKRSARLPAVQSPVNLFTHLASADDPDCRRRRRNCALAIPRRTPSRRAQHRQLRRHAELPERRRIGCGPACCCTASRRSRVRIGADYGLEARDDAELAGHRRQGSRGGRESGIRRQLGGAAPDALAVAAVGYGDGYPRNLASGSPVLVNGERAPLAGRVSMDMIGIDVTDAKIVVPAWAIL
jgi:alanine racemase